MKTTLHAELLGAVSQSIEAQLGLHFPPDRWADLERGLRGGGTGGRMTRAASRSFCGTHERPLCLVSGVRSPADSAVVGHKQEAAHMAVPAMA